MSICCKPSHERRESRALHILVVADEPTEIESLRRGLFLYGHETVGAASAAEALALLSAPAGRRIDVLVTDLTIPGAAGFALIDELRRSRPALPVVAITGLAPNARIEQVPRPGVSILQKPFGPDRLEDAIRALVGKPDAGSIA